MSKASLNFKKYINEVIDPHYGNMGNAYNAAGTWQSGENEMSPGMQPLLPNTFYMAQLDGKIDSFMNSPWSVKPSKTLSGRITRVNKIKYPTSISIEFGNQSEWKLENRYYNRLFSNWEPQQGQNLLLRTTADGRILSYQLT